MSHKNPHSKAAGAYGSVAVMTDQRALEGTVLLKSAQKLEDLAARLQAGEKVSLEEISDTLGHNQKLWQLFVDTMKDPTHLLPDDIKSNVLSLALFVFKRTHDILCNTTPDKFAVLVNINRNIAAGLMKRQAMPATPSAQAPIPSEKIRTDSIA